MTEERDAAQQEREMREHEEEARERDPDERAGGDSGLPKGAGEVDPTSDPDDADKPAPPGGVQQPRG
jgi:hypothetical protein